MKKVGEGKTLAIDFDGVIHQYGNGWQDGQIYDKPVPGAKEALETLKSQGYIILIYSTRCNPAYQVEGGPVQKNLVKNYLDEHGIPYHDIHTGSKPKAYLYIDDRGISFKGDWNQTLKDIDIFKVWNRPNAKSSAELEAESKIK